MGEHYSVVLLQRVSICFPGFIIHFQFLIYLGKVIIGPLILFQFQAPLPVFQCFLITQKSHIDSPSDPVSFQEITFQLDGTGEPVQSNWVVPVKVPLISREIEKFFILILENQCTIIILRCIFMFSHPRKCTGPLYIGLFIIWIQIYGFGKLSNGIQIIICLCKILSSFEILFGRLSLHCSDNYER